MATELISRAMAEIQHLRGIIEAGGVVTVEHLDQVRAILNGLVNPAPPPMPAATVERVQAR